MRSFNVVKGSFDQGIQPLNFDIQINFVTTHSNRIFLVYNNTLELPLATEKKLYHARYSIYLCSIKKIYES